MDLMSLVRALHIAGTVVVAGAFAFRFAVMSPDAQISHEGGVRQEAMSWLQRICLVGVAVALASWIVWLALLAARMSGRSLPGALGADVLGAVLGQTRFGHAWMLRFALMLLLSLTLLRARGAAHAGMRPFAACLAIATLLSLAWSGHALGARPWQLAADALHLLGVGLWLGALLPLVLVLGRAARGAHPAWQVFAAKAIRRFSALGMVAVALIAVTGLVNAERLVGSASHLVDTPYGRLLLAKLTLFAFILALAAINRFVLTPRLTTPGPAFDSAVQPLRRNAVAELVLGAVILAIVAVLGITAPPAHEHGPPATHGHGAMHGTAAESCPVPMWPTLWTARWTRPARRANAGFPAHA